MRNLMFLIVCTLAPYVAYGADMADYNNIISQQQDTEQAIQADFESVRAKVEKLNPSLVAWAHDKSEKTQLVLYRSWLARQMFDYYKDYFVRKIETRGAQSNRQVNKIEYVQNSGLCKAIYIALDNGPLDRPECYKNGIVGSAFQTCPYPDDLEEFYVDIYDCDDQMGLFVMEDDKNANTSTSFSIDLINTSMIEENEKLSDISIDTSVQTESFINHAAYREKERQYNMTPRTKREIKLINRGKIRMDNYPEMPPAHVTAMTFMFTSSQKGND